MNLHLGRLGWVVGVLVALVVLVPLRAQEKPVEKPPVLEKTDKGALRHSQSKSEFDPPKADWVILPPETIGRMSLVSLRQRTKEIEVTISWSPLGPVPWDAVVTQEQELLEMLYGKEKVSKPDQAKSGDKVGSRIVVDDGPTRNDKEAGAVYLFENGPDQKTRWRIKLRVSAPKLARDDCLKAVEDQLLPRFQW